MRPVVLALTLGACGSDDGGGGASAVLDESDVGAEGFVFEGASAGSGGLRMEYVRSFDHPPVPAEMADFQVQVTGP